MLKKLLWACGAAAAVAMVPAAAAQPLVGGGEDGGAVQDDGVPAIMTDDGGYWAPTQIGPVAFYPERDPRGLGRRLGEAHEARARAVPLNTSRVFEDALVSNGVWVIGHQKVEQIVTDALRPFQRRIGGFDIQTVDAEYGVYRVEFGSVPSALQGAAILSWAGLPVVEMAWTASRVQHSVPSDPLVNTAYHFDPIGTSPGALNIGSVYAMGITGADVSVGVVEGGFQTNHPDIINNWGPYAPTLDMPANLFAPSAHHTSAAGIIGASAENGIGASGVAYGSSINQLSWNGFFAFEALYAHRAATVKVRSHSYGSGPFVPLPLSAIEEIALRRAYFDGRESRGIANVFSAGNDFGIGDQAIFEARNNTRYTIPVGAHQANGNIAGYSERGSNLFISGPSNGIVTTDLTGAAGYDGSDYTDGFSGTSAAAPMVAGVIALMMDANPDLEMHEIKEILSRTARQANPGDPLWVTNAAGLTHHPRYGFGLVDAEAAVNMAMNWKATGLAYNEEARVAARRVDLLIPFVIPDALPFPSTATITVPRNVRISAAELVLNGETESFFDLAVVLRSPAGTQSIMQLAVPPADPDDKDDSIYEEEFNNRTWLTYAFNGEESRGTWEIDFYDLVAEDVTTLTSFQVLVYGKNLDGNINSPNPACVGDFDWDYHLTLNDYSSFFKAFAQRRPSGDVNGDGAHTGMDYVMFLNSFRGACGGVYPSVANP